MRRTFNSKLLVTKPPGQPKKSEEIKLSAEPKQRRKPKQKRKMPEEYKTKDKKSDSFEKTFNDYIDQIGQYWSNEALAYKCGVTPKTVNKWSYGYKPGKLCWWPIARYISSYHRYETASDIYLKLEHSLKE